MKTIRYLQLVGCLLCSHLFAYELVVVSLFRNTAPYIKEWVEYHKMAGVDHFWLYNDASTDNWEEVLQPYIEEGLVEVFWWPSGKPDWVPGQMAAFHDGTKRAVGVAKWVALIDQDEFILPMKDATIPECLHNHFQDAAGIYVSWYNFGTSHVTLKKGEPMILRLTQASRKDHGRNCVGKSIFRPEMADIEEMWSPHFCPLKSNLPYYDGSGETSLKAKGSDIKTDGHHHGRYIRINHYAFRDDPYFFEIRLPRDAHPNLMLELYEAFNADRDYAIIQFIKNRHPETYKRVWKPYE